MYWQEDDDQNQTGTSDKVQELVFALKGQAVPVDHAHALADAITQILPWISEERRFGVYSLAGMEEGNGWARGGGADEMIYLSRRSKLILRLPNERADETLALSGQTLQVHGQPLVIGEARSRSVNIASTLYARFVHTLDHVEEEAFLHYIQSELKVLGVRAKKMLCGKARHIRTDNGVIHTRSVMLDGISSEDAMRLLEYGVGPGRHLGCGLFVGHKSID